MCFHNHRKTEVYGGAARPNERKNPLSSDRLYRWDKEDGWFIEPGTHRSTHIKVKIETL